MKGPRLFFSKVWLAVNMSLRGLLQRRYRSSKDELKYFFFYYLVGMVSFTHLRFELGMVSTYKTLDDNGRTILEMGIFPKIEIWAMIFFAIELVLFHIPFYSLCIRRFKDVGYSGWKLFAVLLPLAVPFLGIVYVGWALTRPSESGTNKWGPVPKGFDELLETVD